MKHISGPKFEKVANATAYSPPSRQTVRIKFSHSVGISWALALVNADTMCQAGLQPAIQDRTLGRGIRHSAIKSSHLL